MQSKNARQAGVTKRHLPPGQYWISLEGKRRKELQRLNKFAARPHDMTPRFVKKASRKAKS